MKEWPKVLQERYPRAAPLPDRPWWRPDGDVGKRAYLARRAGSSDQGDFGIFRNEAYDLAPRIDQENPIPFPGLRVGQIWAIVYPTGEPAIFQITEYDADHEDDIGSIERVADEEADPEDPIDRVYRGRVLRRRPWHAGGSWITEKELLDLCRDGFLVADAACPHLAPWGPAEETKSATGGAP